LLQADELMLQGFDFRVTGFSDLPAQPVVQFPNKLMDPVYGSSCGRTSLDALYLLIGNALNILIADSRNCNQYADQD